MTKLRSTFPKPLLEPITVNALLARVGRPILAISGDVNIQIASIASLDESVPGSLTFCRYSGADGQRRLASSLASVVAVADYTAPQVGRCFIHVERPKTWFIAALAVLFPSSPSAGVSPHAVVDPKARIGTDVEIGPCAVIEADVSIGDRCRIGANATLLNGTRIGDDCTIGPGATIGFRGLGLSRDDDDTLHMFPHLGGVIIGNRADIGPNCVIARGVLKDTVIGDGVKLGNLVNIGHNCNVGADCWISSGAMVCGSVSLGERVQLGAACVIKNQTTVADGVHVGLSSVVMKPSDPNDLLFGFPAKPFPKMFRFNW